MPIVKVNQSSQGRGLSSVISGHLADDEGQILAGSRFVDETESVPILHPWIAAIMKEQVKIYFDFKMEIIFLR